LIESILHLFSSINSLICPITRNNHQISCILKVFYNGIGCILMYVMYVYCSYSDFQNQYLNLEFFIQNWNLYFNFEKNLVKFWIIIWFEPEILNPNYYFRFTKLIFLVWKLLIESKNGHFNFEYCYLNLKIEISILEMFI
jgi:hypothetical protein